MNRSRFSILQRRSPNLRLYLTACGLCLVVFLSLIYSLDNWRKATIFYATSLMAYRVPDNALSPVYTDIRELEMNLPQHNLELPYPEGRRGRYVLFSNSRTHLSGWNNKLNDMLMNTWLAYASNRAYVFHDFAWVDSHYPWSISSYRQLSPRTPLSALISGPSAGGPWDKGDPAPRAVSEAYFNIVCPKQERKVINTRDIKPSLRDADGIVIFHYWRALLTKTKERCVEIIAAPQEEDPFPETFDIYYWSTARSLSLWDGFILSPVSRLLSTSIVVESAIEENIGLFLFPLPRSSSSENNQSYHALEAKNTLSSVFSIHVRRGDFKEACLEHAVMNSTFYNWNLLPFLPDKLSSRSSRTENEQQILKRCWPTSDHIRGRVEQAKRTYEAQTGGQDLPVLFMMSNDHTDWIEDLKEAFIQDGWQRVVMSRDLKLNPQQKDVSVAVDMEIGRSSAVFIGNGWSSFTSNVVHRRLVDGKDPVTIRFW